ncbi:MAG: hypothetical protein E6G62_04175, partial [Actinobacteria bacterium]
MSDVPQQADPDLHAIFGIGDSEGVSRDPIIEVDRVAAPKPDVAGDPDAFDTEPVVEVTRNFDEDHGLEAQPPAPGAPPDQRGEPEAARAVDEEEWTGITRPSRSGSSQRFLTVATRRQVDDAIESSRTLGTTPERVLVDTSVITADALARALAERYGLDHLDLGIFAVDMSAANLVSTAVAKRYQAVPVAFADKRTLLVAMADPSNVLAVDDIAIMTGYEIRVAVAPPDDIAALVSRLDRLEDVVGQDEGQLEEAEEEGDVLALHETSDDAPVVKLVNQIVAQAVERGA